MKSTAYDPDILQQQADSLYSQADEILGRTVASYVVMTLLAVFVVLTLLSKINPQVPTGVLLLISVLIAAALGVSHGRDKSFHLKMEAQTLLCQRQIELNTRK